MEIEVCRTQSNLVLHMAAAGRTGEVGMMGNRKSGQEAGRGTGWAFQNFPWRWGWTQALGAESALLYK